MKVMIAIDESKGSFYALNWVLSDILKPIIIATTNNGQEKMEEKEHLVYLVNVNLPPKTYVSGPVVYTTTSVLESVKQKQEQESASIFARALKICEEMKIKAEALTLHGEPKEVICEAAEQRHVDLLVVGSRGLGMLKRAILGSVSDYCSHNAHCPVLIVKPPKEYTIQEEVSQESASKN